MNAPAVVAPVETLGAPEREALLDSVRRLLADRCAEADVRRIMDSDAGHDRALWRSLAEQHSARAPYDDVFTVAQRHRAAATRFAAAA